MKRVPYVAAAGVSVLLALSLAGCGGSSATSGSAASTSAATSASATTVASASTSASSTVQVSTEGLEAYDLEYSKRDLDPSYDTSSATAIDLSAASGDVTISEAGTYILSGKLEGCVYVDISKEEKVQLVLNGVTIHNDNGPCIYVKTADKCFITLAEGSVNTLSDGANYELDEEEEPTAVIFSKEDLCINGTGALNITANYRHGVRSKDDLIITGGTFNITAVEDGLNGKDCLKICDGTFTITCGEDALKSSNSDEEGRGFVAIDGGTFTINAGDDGVHAETLMRITGGTVDIQSCYEGYEGIEVRIDGGTTSIVASDDGINAANSAATGGDAAMGDFGGFGRGAGPTGMAEGGVGVSSEDCKIIFNAGTTYVSSGGDGIDSNGSVEMNGGLLIVEGPTSNGDGAFDYDLSATCNGGTVLMVGSTGMAQNFTSGTQAFAMTSVNGSTGQQVSLVDAKGNTVASFTATKSFQCAVVTIAGAQEGDTFTLKVGGTSTELTASTTATSGMGGLGSNGQGMGPGQQGNIANIGGGPGRR